MGVDFGYVPAGDKVSINIVVHGKVQRPDGKAFSEAVCAAIKRIRDAQVIVDVSQDQRIQVQVAGNTLSARQVEALHVHLKAALKSLNSEATVTIRRVGR